MNTEILIGVHSTHPVTGFLYSVITDYNHPKFETRTNPTIAKELIEGIHFVEMRFLGAPIGLSAIGYWQ